MAINFYPANLQWVGAARESVYGTPITAPTFWIPAEAPKWIPEIAVFQDTALRGSMGAEFQQIQGLRSDKLTYSSYPYMDTIYQHAMAMFGNPDTVTGAGDPYTHKTSLYNGSGSNSAQPPSYTLFYIDGAGSCWQIPGAVASNFKINLDVGQLVKFDYEWIGLPATRITVPTNTPDTNKPWPSWNSTITIGGSAVTYYSALSLDYKRNTKPLPTITGTQTPAAIYAGELAVSGDLTAVYQGNASGDLPAFLANTQPALVIKTAPASDVTHSLTLQHSVVAYDSSAPEGASEWMEIKSKVRCLTNPTDGLTGQSPVQATFLTPTAAAF